MIDQKDITIYYPFWTGKKYVTMPYSFLGTVSSFTDAKDSFEFIKESFLSKEECDYECKMLNIKRKEL